jgi:two-component system nitrogen regulation response regulator GlnG
MSHVLIVDDEPSICWGFRELLTDEGYDVSVASSAEEAFVLADRSVPDAVVLDVRLPGRDGLSTIQDLRRRIGPAPIIVITAFGNLDTAVRALEEGAYDYLTKPFDLEQICDVLRRALRRSGASGAEPAAEEPASVSEIFIGTSPAMQAVFKQIALVAPSDVPVLITGESGTGKELVAQAIHRHSRRKDAPFLPTCLAALSEGVIESELFGHVRGAFTGAEQARQGLLELADGGTVFLDEIGDVPLPVQVKLLRAIEQHEVTPVGDARARRTDFRVLAATHRALGELVAQGEFREDLFYRLGVFHIHVPPLRERVEDIPLLARGFLRTATGDGRTPDLSAGALAELASRRWPGNVRELRNAVERAALMSRGGEIEADHFAPAAATSGKVVRTSVEELQLATANWTCEQLDRETERGAADVASGDLLERFLRAVEPPLLKAVLARCGGNRAAAAKVLGIHRATLRQKLTDSGLNCD